MRPLPNQPDKVVGEIDVPFENRAMGRKEGPQRQPAQERRLMRVSVRGRGLVLPTLNRWNEGGEVAARRGNRVASHNLVTKTPGPVEHRRPTVLQRTVPT